MKGIDFRKLAPNSGLQIGAGVAKGLQDATSNYMKMRQQRMQMDYQRAHMASMQQNSQALMQWRQAQTEALRKKQLGEDAQKLDYAIALHHAGILPEQITAAQIKGTLKDVLAGAKPQDAAIITNWIDQRRANNEPLTPEPMSALESKSYEGRLANESKDQRLDKAIDSKEGIAADRNDTAIKIAGMRKSGGMTFDQRVTLHQLDALAREHDQLQKDWDAADKPNSLGMKPEPDDVNKKRADLEAKMDALAKQGAALKGAMSPSGSSQKQSMPGDQPQPHTAPGATNSSAGSNLTAPGQPGAPGQVVPYSNRMNAIKGDKILSPDGKSVGLVSDVIGGVPHIDQSTISPFVPTQPPQGPQPSGGE